MTKQVQITTARLLGYRRIVTAVFAGSTKRTHLIWINAPDGRGIAIAYNDEGFLDLSCPQVMNDMRKYYGIQET